jgi:hypothetical protein
MMPGTVARLARRAPPVAYLAEPERRLAAVAHRSAVGARGGVRHEPARRRVLPASPARSQRQCHTGQRGGRSSQQPANAGRAYCVARPTHHGVPASPSMALRDGGMMTLAWPDAVATKARSAAARSVMENDRRVPTTSAAPRRTRGQQHYTVVLCMYYMHPAQAHSAQDRADAAPVVILHVINVIIPETCSHHLVTIASIVRSITSVTCSHQCASCCLPRPREVWFYVHVYVIDECRIVF